jgi:hypothetical protein
MKLLIRRFSSAVDILVSLGVSVAFGHDVRFPRAGSIYCLVMFFSARKALNLPRGHIYTSDLNMTQEAMHCDVFELWKLVRESMEV